MDTTKDEETTVERIRVPNRRQLDRLVHIVSVLKQNRKVTIASLISDFAEKAWQGDSNSKDCSVITVKRDMRLLRETYNCPVVYDRGQKTFRLKDLEWDFNMPSVVGEHAVMAAVLGAKLAEDVFPPSVSSMISGAVDELLKNNSADLNDRTMVQSLKIFARMGVEGTTDVFPIVFEAWKRHRVLKLWYEKPGEPVQERVVKPMALVFANRKWNLYSYCDDVQDYRIFVLSRIHKAEKMREVFDVNLEAIEKLHPETFLQYDMLHNVHILITAKAKAFVEGNFISCTPVIKPRKDGRFTLVLPRVPLEAVVPWVLAQGGEAAVLSPQEAVDAVRTQAEAVLKAAQAVSDNKTSLE